MGKPHWCDKHNRPKHKFCNEKQNLINSVYAPQVSQLTQAVTQKVGQISNLSQIIAQRDAQITQLTQVIVQKDAQINQQTIQLGEEQKKVQKLELENQHLREQQRELFEQIEKLKIENPIEIKDINSDLVAYYPFFKGSTMDTAHQNHGLAHDASFATDRCDKQGNALYFDGESYIKGDATHFPRNERTISIWFKPNNTKEPIGTLFSYGGHPQQEGTSWNMVMTNRDGEPYCEVQTANNRSDFFGPAKLNSTVSNTAWNHFVATTSYNHGTCLYLNGEQVNPHNKQFVSDTFVEGTEFFIGKKMKGMIDEVRIYDRALSEVDVKKLYETPKVNLKKLAKAKELKMEMANPSSNVHSLFSASGNKKEINEPDVMGSIKNQFYSH